MAGQGKTLHQTEALHAQMIAAFGVGCKMSRDTFDAMIMRSLCCGYPQAANIGKGGEALGLWRRMKGQAGGPNGGRQVGWVELLPAPETQVPSLV